MLNLCSSELGSSNLPRGALKEGLAVVFSCPNFFQTVFSAISSRVDALPDGRATRLFGYYDVGAGPAPRFARLLRSLLRSQVLSSILPFGINAHYPAIKQERSAWRSIGLMAD